MGAIPNQGKRCFDLLGNDHCSTKLLGLLLYIFNLNPSSMNILRNKTFHRVDLAVTQWMAANGEVTLLGALLIWRLFGTLVCFCSGIPGGVFAPLLALGTLFGCLWAAVLHHVLPGIPWSQESFGLVGMSALFAASVRAPITGILLVTEMSNNFSLILPMMMSTLGATLVAQALGGKPLYSQILARTLRLAAWKAQSESHATAKANT